MRTPSQQRASSLSPSCRQAHREVQRVLAPCRSLRAFGDAGQVRSRRAARRSRNAALWRHSRPSGASARFRRVTAVFVRGCGPRSSTPRRAENRFRWGGPDRGRPQPIFSASSSSAAVGQCLGVQTDQIGQPHFRAGPANGGYGFFHAVQAGITVLRAGIRSIPTETRPGRQEGKLEFLGNPQLAFRCLNCSSGSPCEYVKVARLPNRPAPGQWMIVTASRGRSLPRSASAPFAGSPTSQAARAAKHRQQTPGS